jgi:hypothetical protein
MFKNFGFWLRLPPSSQQSASSLVGATDPSDAKPGTIRGDFCVDKARNLVHASGSCEAAKREIASCIKLQELTRWKSCQVEWIYEDEVEEEQEVGRPCGMKTSLGNWEESFLLCIT